MTEKCSHCGQDLPDTRLEAKQIAERICVYNEDTESIRLLKLDGSPLREAGVPPTTTNKEACELLKEWVTAIIEEYMKREELIKKALEWYTDNCEAIRHLKNSGVSMWEVKGSYGYSPLTAILNAYQSAKLNK